MDWVIVQVVIGLSFLFFLLSIVTSAVNEAIAGIFKLRATTLEKGITNLITGATTARSGGTELVQQLYAHPLINAFGKDTHRPSYLASESFRSVLFDITGLLDVTAEPTPAGDPLEAREIQTVVDRALGEIPNESLRASLTTIWRSAHSDIDAFRAGVEQWFDRGMERVSGWYKRRTQIILFVVGLALAVVLNASAITAADRLWKDEGFRRGLIAQVEQRRAETDPSDALARLEALRFPIGWEESNQPEGVDGWALSALGWLLTGIAVTFGAPFWFDLLNKVSNLRAAGRKPETSPPSPSPAR